MIDEKKITEEVSDVYDEMFLGDTDGTIHFDNGDQEEAHTPQQVREFFLIKWAEQEFVKSLWHDASEKPSIGCLLLGCDVNGYSLYSWQRQEDTWEMFADICGLKKWCYLSDLLPKEETESTNKQYSSTDKQ